MANAAPPSSNLIDLLELSLTTDRFRWPQDRLQFPQTPVILISKSDHHSTAATEEIKKPSMPKSKSLLVENARKLADSIKRKTEDRNYGDGHDESRKRPRIQEAAPAAATALVKPRTTVRKTAPKKKAAPWFVRIRKERANNGLLGKDRPGDVFQHRRPLLLT